MARPRTILSRSSTTADTQPGLAGAPEPDRLSLEAIVATAIEVAEEHGYDKLTMRRLADALGVGTMTLYGYFRTKDQLLSVVADRMFGEVEVPQDGNLPWQEQIIVVLRAVHDLLIEHPKLAEIVARRSVDGLSASRLSEQLLAGLRRSGLDDRTAVLVYDSLSAFTVAFALREAARRDQAAMARQRLLAIDELPEADYENVRELSWLLVGGGSTGRFEDALRMYIRGIECTINEGERDAVG
jgi:TetR/AcrR family transcriptional regulator, tetracycline repressor protein